MIDVCFFADEVSKTDFEEAIKLGVEAGANTVEIRGGVWGKHVTEIDDDDVQRVQDVLSAYNVRVASIGSPFGKCAIDDPQEYDQHRKHFDRMVTLAHAFDTQVIRGFTFWNPNRRTKGAPRPDISDYMERIVEKLSLVVPIAESADVTLCFENESACLAGSSAKRHVQLLMLSEIAPHSPLAGMSITGYTAAKIRSQTGTPTSKDSCDICMSNRIVRKILILSATQNCAMHRSSKCLLRMGSLAQQALNTGDNPKIC